MSSAPWSSPLAGNVERHLFNSALLRDNPLGDPAQRPLLVYTPPEFQASGTERYPTVYVLQGYSGNVDMWFNRNPFRNSFFELVDAVFSRGDTPPAIIVCVDGFNAYGGSQYLDSPGSGRYHSYLCDEVVPWIDANYPTLANRDHRAIAGKSTGGFAAMITPLLRPDLFGALATHAGDAHFDVGYRVELARRSRILRQEYGGSYDAFLRDFRTRIPGTKASDIDLMEVYAYSAAYSADEDGTVHTPVDALGRLRPEVWERWLSWDPVRMSRAPEHIETVRSLRAVWIDAGLRDEYYLDVGAAAYHHALSEAGVDESRIHFELFDGGHGTIEYRYPMSMAWLCGRISN